MTKRVLLLHGYSQNAALFRKRMSVIRKQCGDQCEFVFLDGPQTLKPVDIADLRSWWLREKTEECIIYLRDYLANQEIPFDGVFGFSQGAAVAAVLTGLLEKPTLLPVFLKAGKPPHPPLKFGVFVSGFRPRESQYLSKKDIDLLDPIFESGIKTPTLHVIGGNDTIVTPERSAMLSDACVNARIERHEGGHFVPSKANWRTFFADYLTSADSPEQVPSPNPFSLMPPTRL